VSLDVNRALRLRNYHVAMGDMLAAPDFAGTQIETYRELLFRSLEALDAGIADQLIDAMRLIYSPPLMKAEDKR
jgi:hypothetical protein